MDKSKLVMIGILTLVAILLCIVLWIIAIVGGMDLTDGCLYRYNFDGDGSVSSADKLTDTITLKANANYTALSSETTGAATSLDPTTYGKWLNTNLRVASGQKVSFVMKGDISLCKSYIPRYNLQDESDRNISNEVMEIPRYEETPSTPATLIFDAKTNEWRNLTQVFKNDKIVVTLQRDKKSSASSSSVYSSIRKGNVSADCSEGKRAYQPICGRYSLWNAASPYVDKCEYVAQCYECNCSEGCYTRGAHWSFWPSNESTCHTNSGDWERNCDWCSCYRNINGVAPEPYKNDGKYTSPWSNDINALFTNFNRDCTTEHEYVGGEYQNKKYFWFSADDAAGLLYRFDSNLNPTNKTTRGSGYLFAAIQEDQSYLNGADNQQIIMNTIYTGSDIGYLQYRFHDSDPNFADNTGGYVLSVKQTKCRRTNGNVFNDTLEGRGAVQYIIADYGKNPNNDMSGLATGNIIVDANGSGSITASSNNQGYLWMKIKNSPDDYKDSFGQYQVQFFTEVERGGFYRDVLDPFFEGFKGKIKGAAVTVFKNMTCYKGLGGEGNCTNFFTYIKAILILYIMTYGMMFLLGMVKISQTDLVVRVVKIAFVSGLMNDSTFEFFNTYVFDFTTEFSDTIIANMSGYSLFSGSTSISNPMMFMNEVMTKIFLSSTFAAQIMALPAMGLNGVLYFILMIVCIGIIIIVLFRAIAIYLMAYMAIAVLIGISPLFLTFILFEKTRHLFDNWVKFTFRYMLEPIIMLAGIIILTQLFTIYLDYVIGYSVCWKCAIPIKIPFPNIEGVSPAFLDVELFCFNWFAPWGFDHRSSQMGLSMQNMVVLLMIAYCLWGYIDFSASIVGRIAGGAGGPSATGMGQAMSGAAENSMLKKVGLDAESREAMKGQAKERLKSMRKGDKKAPLEKGNRHDVEKEEGSKSDPKSDPDKPKNAQTSSSSDKPESSTETAKTSWKKTAPSTSGKKSGIQIGGRPSQVAPDDSKARQGVVFGPSDSKSQGNISVEEGSANQGITMSEGAKIQDTKAEQPVGIVKKMVAKFEALINQSDKGGSLSESSNPSAVQRSGIETKVSDKSKGNDSENDE